MISANSRYAASQTVFLPFGDGTMRQTIVAGEQYDFTFNFSWHTVAAGERIDDIANFYYGDAQKWWFVADGNPEILDWMDLVPGMIIRVPNG